MYVCMSPCQLLGFNPPDLTHRGAACPAASQAGQGGGLAGCRFDLRVVTIKDRKKKNGGVRSQAKTLQEAYGGGA